MSLELKRIQSEIISCNACTRLRAHCEKIARDKKRATRDDRYWGKPVPGFGDPEARLLIIGLAPAAHGANRTGRMFTGDRSGDWLYRALYKAQFANQPTSVSASDGLILRGAYITAAGRCAPPGNKPSPSELKRCSSFLEREMRTLKNVQVFLTLGQIALDAFWKIAEPNRRKPKFNHGGYVKLEDSRHLLMSYHPSQQNTFTGRLTEPMFDSVFDKANQILHR